MSNFSMLNAAAVLMAMCLAPFSAQAAKPSDDDAKRPSKTLDAIATGMAKIRADDDMLVLLKTFAALDPKAIEKLTPAEARAQPTIADAVKAELKNQGRDSDPLKLVPGVTSADRMVQGAAGELPARVFTPDGAGPFPVIVYFHGGGWVIADKDVYDAGARGLAKQANAVVVSVDYRQAPENKFPAAWDDALAAYRWVTQNAGHINGDGKHFALAGESAGGNLAVATAVAARDAKLTMPMHVLAVYPVAQNSVNTESEIENAIAKPLNRSMIQWFLDKTLRTPQDKNDTRLDLVHANLKGLPTTTIINARIDPLRSDGAKLEDALKDAGVPVQRKSYEGVTHEFFGAAAVVQKARDAQQYAGMRLKQSFERDAQMSSAK